MTRSGLLQFIRCQRLAVLASIGPSGAPQAATIGIAVTDALEIVFDSVDVTRKVHNIRSDARVALVIGGSAAGEERTVQYEGIADEPSGDELERLKEAYFGAHPDGRERLRWPGLVYIRTRPTWIRYSDFSGTPVRIVELDAASLRDGGQGGA